VPDSPNYRIHVDLFQVPKPSAMGNKYVLVITCAFNKLVELVPLPNKEAETVASAIFSKWICRFACPREIVSDRGREFCNKLQKELWSFLHVDQKFTSAHHPQTNASCERFNREAWKLLSALMSHPDLDDWESLLPTVMLTYNTRVHEATNFSPFYLTYLQDPNLPFFDMAASRPMMGEDWATDAKRRMVIAYKLVKDNIAAAGARNAHYYNRGTTHREFYPGDFVMVFFDRSTFPVRNKKLVRQWKKHVIIKRVGNTTYHVRCILSDGKLGPTSSVHRNRIKPFFGPPTPLLDIFSPRRHSEVEIRESEVKNEEEDEEEEEEEEMQQAQRARQHVPTANVQSQPKPQSQTARNQGQTDRNSAAQGSADTSSAHSSHGQKSSIIQKAAQSFIRPTRSTFRAPTIGPLPAKPIEYGQRNRKNPPPS